MVFGMNFFNLYGKAKKSLYQSKIIISAIVFALITAAVVGAAYLHDVRTQWDNKITPLEEKLERMTNSDERLSVEQTRLDAYRRLYDIAVNIDSAINTVNFFTDDDARVIIEAMPAGVTVNKFILDGINLEITGMLDNMAILPSLMHNLKATGLFVDVSTTSAILYQSVDGSPKNADRFTGVNPQADDGLFSDANQLTTEKPNSPGEADQQAAESLQPGISPKIKESSDSSSGTIVYSISCWLKGSALT